MTDEPRDEAIAAQVHAPIDVLLEQEGQQWTLVMRRRFPHSPRKLWQMLTDPALLARWSPIVPDRPLNEPGPATCRENPGDDPRDAEVLVAEAPRRLVHRWDAELLAWTITPDGDGATLELRQTLSDHTWASLAAAGWQVCLGRLAAETEGVERVRVVGERAWDYGCRDLIEQYRGAFATADAESQEGLS